MIRYSGIGWKYWNISRIYWNNREHWQEEHDRALKRPLLQRRAHEAPRRHFTTTLSFCIYYSILYVYCARGSYTHWCHHFCGPFWSAGKGIHVACWCFESPAAPQRISSILRRKIWVIPLLLWTRWLLGRAAKELLFAAGRARGENSPTLNSGIHMKYTHDKGASIYDIRIIFGFSDFLSLVGIWNSFIL